MSTLPFNKIYRFLTNLFILKDTKFTIKFFPINTQSTIISAIIEQNLQGSRM